MKQVRVKWLSNGHFVSTRRRNGTRLADGHLDVLFNAAAILIVNDRNLWLVGTRTRRERGALLDGRRSGSRAEGTTPASSSKDAASEHGVDCLRDG